jgi:hypothetical protein
MRALVTGALILVTLGRGWTADPPSDDQRLLVQALETLATTQTQATQAATLSRLRLSTDLDLAAVHYGARRTLAHSELLARLATVISAPRAQTMGMARGQVCQESAQALQNYLQSLAQIEQELIQKTSEAYQRFAQGRNTEAQNLAQTISSLIGSFSQGLTAAERVATPLALTPVWHDLDAPPTAAVRDAETRCRTELQTARHNCDTTLHETKRALEVEVGTVLGQAGMEPALQRTSLSKAVKRYAVIVTDTLDNYDLAVRAAIRKFALIGI